MVKVKARVAISSVLSKKVMQRCALFFCSLVLCVGTVQPGVAVALQTSSSDKKFNTDYDIKPLESKPESTKLNGLQGEVGAPKSQDIKDPRSKKYEDVSERTNNSSTYINKDGTRTVEYSLKSQNYKNGNKWERIDNKLEPVSSIAPSAVKVQPFLEVNIPTKPIEIYNADAGILDIQMMSLSKGVSISMGGKPITLKPVGSNDAKPLRKDESTTIYKNAWRGVDLEYQADGELLKENIILKQKDIATQYEFKVQGAKLIDDLKNPGFFTIEGAKEGFRFGGLTLSLNDRGPIDIPANSIKQERTTNNSIKVTIDKKWLAALPQSSFPVIIDPSFGRWDADATDWMFKSNGYSCTGANCWIQAGTLNDGGWKHWRSYVHIPYPELAGGKKVLDANIHAYYNPHANPDPNQRYLFFGHASCIGWECRGKHLSTVLTAGDFDVNVTAELQNAVNNGNMGATWSFWGEEVPYKTFKTYSDMHLSVVYDTPTPIARPLDPVNQQVIIDTQQTLKVNPVKDGDGDAVKYYFRVSTSPGAESGAVINSGWIDTPQWTIPEGVLQDGSTYYWHTYTMGATETSPDWTSSFKVDLRTGKDSTQSYDTVGPVGIGLATGNATLEADTHNMSALGGSIGLSLTYDTPNRAKKGLTAQYWNTSVNYPFGSGVPKDALGKEKTPNLTRRDQNIDFNWGSSAIGPGLQSDWVYARWSGQFVAPATGTYQFGTSVDDATRIRVAGQDMLNQGCASGVCYNNSKSISLSAGQVVPITVDYLEQTGAAYNRIYVKGAVPEQVIPRDWLFTDVVNQPQTYGLTGRYYTDTGDRNITTAAADPMRLMMQRHDTNLNLNFGNGGPAAGLQSDKFMARWTGYITVPTSGNYVLGMSGDDGARIKLNNGAFGAQNTVLDSWNYTGTANRWGGSTSLAANTPVPITIDYSEDTGPASFRLIVRTPNGSETEVPATWLTPQATSLPEQWKLGVDIDGNVGYERLRVGTNSVILEDSTRSTHEYTYTNGAYKPPVNEDGVLTKNSDNTFNFLDTDGRTYVFDASGKLTSLTSPTDDRQPAALKYVYDGDPARLVKIQDGVTPERFGTLHYKNFHDDNMCGAPAGFDAAPNGMLCAFKTSDGDVTRFYYKNGNLARIEEPGNQNTDYGYDEFGRITSVREPLASDVIASGVRQDPLGVNTDISYDSLGRVVGVKAPAATEGATRIEHALAYQTNRLLPLYRLIHLSNPDHKAMTSQVVSGYRSEFFAGYLLSAPEAGTRILYSCLNGWDEFVSTDVNCEGGQKLGILGSAYIAAPAEVNSKPIYRCSIPANGDRFISHLSTCEGYTQNSLLGYVISDGGHIGSTAMNTKDASEPVGYSKKVNYDGLLRTVREFDVTGNSTQTEWDKIKDLQLSTTETTGLKSTIIYDALDRAIENYGAAPSTWFGADRKPLPAQAANVPKTATGYDEGITGLGVSVYPNAKLLQTPKHITTGMNNLPNGSYSLDLTNSLVTPSDGISARATGKIKLNAVGKYSFRAWHGGGARVYVDNNLVSDSWTDGVERFSPVGTFTNPTAGQYVTLTVEFYKKGTAGAGVNNRLFASLSMQEPGSTVWTEQIGSLLTPAYNLTTSSTAFDAQAGDVTSKTTYSRPEYGTVSKTAVDPTGVNLESQATYEAPGAGYLRQTSKTLPGGGTTQYHYYSASDTRDNPCTPATESFRQAGRPKGKTEADPDGTGPKNGRTSETIYNESGDVIATRYGNEDWTCTTYDTRGRVVTTVTPAIEGRTGRTLTNDYAVDGNPLATSTTDESGTITVENDLLGRTLKYVDARGKSTNNTYDQFGKLLSRVSPIGTETYEYDNYDRLTKHKLDTVTFATVSYDSFSRLSGVQYPAGISLSAIGRDALQRENSTTFTVGDQAISDTVNYFTSGDVKDGIENGVTKSYQYDNTGRLTGAVIGVNTFNYSFGPSTAVCSSLAGNNTLSGKSGNRTQLTINGASTTYCYDQADRLISSSDATLTDATYDMHGNTTSLGSGANKTEFAYDADDRNSKMKTSARETTYTRDAQDRIIKRLVKNGTTTTSEVGYGFTGSGDTPDVLLNSANQVVQKYLTLPGDVIVTIKPQSTSAGATIFSIPNIHGDVMATVNADGAITGKFMTGAFGETLPVKPAQLTAGMPGNTATGTSWGYVGQHQKVTDTETTTVSGGIIQMGARVYLPTLGRFLQVDPVEGGGDNTYAYVNDPVNENDLDGRIAPLVAFAAWQLGRIAIQQAAKYAVKQAATQAVKQVSRKTAQTVAKKMVQKAPYKMTRHATQRSVQRGISHGTIRNTINYGTKLRYTHQGIGKVGYYNPSKRIFVGTQKKRVTTVINKVNRNYVTNLYRGR